MNNNNENFYQNAWQAILNCGIIIKACLIHKMGKYVNYSRNGDFVKVKNEIKS